MHVFHSLLLSLSKFTSFVTKRISFKFETSSRTGIISTTCKCIFVEIEMGGGGFQVMRLEESKVKRFFSILGIKLNAHN